MNEDSQSLHSGHQLNIHIAKFTYSVSVHKVCSTVESSLIAHLTAPIYAS